MTLPPIMLGPVLASWHALVGASVAGMMLALLTGLWSLPALADQENKLVEPGGITLLGKPIDLRIIETPTFILSTREDHIAPWKSTFAATKLYSGPVEFVLSASGHIAGVVNPPEAEKYNYWTDGGGGKAATPEEWLATAVENSGSWWPHWAAWVKKHSGKQVKARKPGAGKLPAIEDAPGSYVRVKATA